MHETHLLSCMLSVCYWKELSWSCNEWKSAVDSWHRREIQFQLSVTVGTKGGCKPAKYFLLFAVVSVVVTVDISGSRCLWTPGLCLLFASGDPSCLRLLQELSSQKQLSWSLTLLSPSFTVLSLHHLILHGHEPTAIKAFLARACTIMCRCVLASRSAVLCVSFVFSGAVRFCLARSTVHSCTNWVFMVHIQALIPIMQTIKNLRRTVFYNLILK